MKTQPRFSSDNNAEDLQEFCGTEDYYKSFIMPHFVYTEGVRHLFDSRDSYWLGQLISGLYSYNEKLKGESFITCELSVESHTGVLVFTDGNDNVLLQEKIPFTDFPDKGVSVWLVDGVLLLPSEY